MSAGLPRSRLAPAVRFTVEEGRHLDVLAALLGRGGGSTLAAGPRMDRPRQEMLEAGATRIARAVLRWLVRDEGWRDRDLLRDGRRTHGRAWDAHLGAGFAPRYTVASRDLWLAAAAHLPLLATLDAGREDARRASRDMRAAVATSGLDAGDVLFFALAHEGLRSFRLPVDDERALRRRMRQASPLALLLEVDAEASVDELRGAFARLTAPSLARAVECAEGRVARAWSNAAQAAWSSRAGTDDLVRRWTSLARTADAWLHAIDRARRMDLARPCLRLVADLAAGPFSGGGESVREALARTPWLRSTQERDTLFAAVAGVAEHGRALARRRDELAGERYGDPRYDEAQLFVREYDRIAAPARRAMEGVGRALSSVLG